MENVTETEVSPLAGRRGLTPWGAGAGTRYIALSLRKGDNAYWRAKPWLGKRRAAPHHGPVSSTAGLSGPSNKVGTALPIALPPRASSRGWAVKRFLAVYGAVWVLERYRAVLSPYRVRAAVSCAKEDAQG